MHAATHRRACRLTVNCRQREAGYDACRMVRERGPMIQISSNFDGGAIELERAQFTDDIAVRIRRDSHFDFTQWFYFRVSGVRGAHLKLQFLNAGQCTYPQGWAGYHVVASYDRQHWFRIPTRFADGVMTVSFVADADTLYLAYFEPY